jgi:hypothetical protein
MQLLFTAAARSFVGGGNVREGRQGEMSSNMTKMLIELRNERKTKFE